MNGLAIFPFSSLRMPAREVPEDEFDAGLALLAQNLADVMVAYGGVGLAANQVGSLLRVIAVREMTPKMTNKVMVMVNPVVVDRSEETSVGMEGCLSLPGVQVPVTRHDKVRVQGVTERGEVLDWEADDQEARVFQHEIDHLDGVLMIDRTDARTRRQAVTAVGKAMRAEHLRHLNEESPLSAQSLISVPTLNTTKVEQAILTGA